MKQLFIISLVLLPLLQQAQTIVSTEPQNKNVVLEQYTGIHCGFCPQGSAVANQIYNANPDRVVLIAIHGGSFAIPAQGEPDFRTPFGAALIAQAGVKGFPAGSVNRHIFPGMEMTQGKTAMGRNHWNAATGQILQQPSYVNVGANAIINVATREISVNVEAYYTRSGAPATNKVNVVLLQDGTVGPQAGGGANYVHNNRMIHMITGQWGETISQTTQGSLYTHTFTYTIPPTHNQVPINMEKLRVAVFVAEGNQEIITGKQVTPTFTGPEFEYQVMGLAMQNEVFEGKIAPKFKVKSLGTQVNSLNIEYKVNSEQAHTFTWQGNPQVMEIFQIDLPEITFNVQQNNTLSIKVLNNDDTPNNNSLTATILLAPESLYNEFVLEIKPDFKGSETTWNIVDQSGNQIVSGGPYPNNNTSIKLHELTIENGFYTLNVFDTNGDGINNGYVKLIANNETLINIAGNTIGSEISRKIRVNSSIIVVFNPTDGEIDVSGYGPYTITSNAGLLTNDNIALDADNVYQAVTMNKNDAEGEIIPYTAQVTNGTIVTITPDEKIPDNTVVYLAYNGKNTDGFNINKKVKFTVRTVVGIANNQENEISIYPNPAKTTFNISGIDNGYIHLYTTSGQLATEHTISSSNESIAIPNGLKGVYFAKITTNNGVIVKPLVIE